MEIRYTINEPSRGRYTVAVVGESFRNYDGTDRQQIIRNCRVGDPILLEPEPANRHDKNAIAVLLATTGRQIGYISRDNAKWIGEVLRKGGSFEASIHGIHGDGDGPFGVTLLLVKR
jgi:hypothetical protein